MDTNDLERKFKLLHAISHLTEIAEEAATYDRKEILALASKELRAAATELWRLTIIKRKTEITEVGEDGAEQPWLGESYFKVS